MQNKDSLRTPSAFPTFVMALESSLFASDAGGFPGNRPCHEPPTTTIKLTKVQLQRIPGIVVFCK